MAGEGLRLENVEIIIVMGNDVFPFDLSFTRCARHDDGEWWHEREKVPWRHARFGNFTIIWRSETRG